MKRIIFLLFLLLLYSTTLAFNYRIKTGEINANRIVLYHDTNGLSAHDSVVKTSVTSWDTTVTLVDGKVNTIYMNLQYNSGDSILFWPYAEINLSKVTVVDSTAGDISYIANNSGDFKATGFSTFNSASDKVTVVDSTAGDISYIADNPSDFKATGFSTFNSASDSVIVDMSSFNAALDNDTTLVNFLRYIYAAIDSLRVYEGAKVGCKSTVVRASDADTMKLYFGVTEYMRLLVIHKGGSAGDNPDSSRTAAP